MTSIFRSIVHSSIRRSIQAGSFVQQVLQLTWVFLTGVADFTFTRTGDQFGIDSGGNLVKSTTDISAHIFGEGILLEGARTNLQQQSDVFDDAAWSKTALTVTPNAIAAPDGTTTADLLIPTAASSAHFVLQNISVTTGLDYSQSFFVKAGGYNFVQFTGSSGFNSAEWFNVDLSTGLIGNSAMVTSVAKIKALGNSWFRVSISDAALSTISGRFIAAVYNTDVASRLPAFVGDTVSGVHFWLGQMEQAAFPSSGVTTLGATATRSTTDMRRLWPFPANGISELIIWRPQYDATDDKGSDLQIINMSDGTENNYLRVTVDQTNDQIHLKKRVSAGTEVVVSTPVSALNYVKGDRKSVRLVADGNGLDLWVDALTKVSTATGDAPTDWTTRLTTIELPPSFHTVESSRVWNQANPDSFMENLT